MTDMDLCCLIDAKGPILPASDLVNTLGDLLERGKDCVPVTSHVSVVQILIQSPRPVPTETKFKVQRLPYARIPIVKLALDPSGGLPFGISCDIGFENRLALENTRLLLSYASIDPTRVRTIVLFRGYFSLYCGRPHCTDTRCFCSQSVD